MMKKIFWILLALVGAWCFGILALHRGESISALYLVVAAVCIYVIAYRFYSAFIASRVLGLDDARQTPAVYKNDGRDFVPTNRFVLFGHHFAAIAGAGPLVGPILAAQMGYLPSMIWILVGGVLAGSVHDFVVLFASTRRGGKSLGEMIKEELGSGAGSIASLAIFGIMVIIIAILAMVVVKALAKSPWGLFSIFMTIPIAILMGVYMRYIRPGMVGEASVIGFVLLMLSLYFGHHVAADPTLASYFTFDEPTLAIMIICYGFVASVLPVWLLLAPRDYLSTFLKIGVILVMALAIVLVLPDLKMPAVTHFTDGSGPVFAGSLFPFLFITIACGAISGFHGLIASGTTPKMLAKESHARMVGYGSMLMESAVAIMALIAASILDPGVYFAINSPVAVLGSDVYSASSAIASLGFVVRPEDLLHLTRQIGEETLLSRTGGAPTFAVGLSLIMHKLIGGEAFMAFWYHFAILFEALFILTAVDAGTRTCRFMIQDMLGNLYKPLADTKSLPAGLFATLLCVLAWGYFLYQGAIDPQGGIFTLWPLFGVSNQMLALMALMLVLAILFKMKREKFAFIVALPAVFVFIATMSAGVQKVLPSNGERIHDKISHVATAQNLNKSLATMEDGRAKDRAKSRMINNIIDAVLCIFFMLTTCIVCLQSIRICLQCKSNNCKYPLREEGYGLGRVV
ncbi:carbon starvation CstA family protein [Helicobacter mustelae]|uniref:Carbon starvation protein A homolog n=1 Tax=Helicobacter mustelae (strain ATCC 43772 / CCUG 25715 / CIP 103759 / LMG 18044 / NCTC 12198 / R85-136P) TaxID=679897 RepID=D3UGR0_HELM1|nr:carbon starvation CstA family protein [Helicobacter mustelae]CBG39681.1 carbon starvation protein A homolog [Helicobacter mustelae 12198]SQH71186.1 carbon starvation protein A [Helicobacter mustelae]